MKPKAPGTSVRTLAVGLVLATIGVTGGASAVADEADARNLFKAMSDYLGAQTSISFDYDSDLEIVSTYRQKVALASSGAFSLTRPDKVRASRRGGFADVELVFDGKTLTLLGKDANAYAQVEIPGTIDQLIDQLRDKYDRPVPGADLLLTNVHDELMPLVVDVKDLGTGVIGGVECNHLAFRTDEVDWQIWIAAGDQPYPCRYVITSKQVEGFPEYSVEISNWKTGDAVAAVDFGFEPPANAEKMDLDRLPDVDELPSIYAVGGAK